MTRPRDPNIPRRNQICPVHGYTEFSLYEKCNGSIYPGWRCMQCSAQKAREYYAEHGAHTARTDVTTEQPQRLRACDRCFVQMGAQEPGTTCQECLS